jgi:geranylgeranyl reductase family protein
MSTHTNQIYDVAIAGAGPAGSFLAYTLAKQGVRVLLLEKHSLPRDKVCAGGLTVRAASIIPFDLSGIIESTIFGINLSYRSVFKEARTYEKPIAYTVMRDKFDFLLTSQAVAAGVELREGVEIQSVIPDNNQVRLKTSRESFTTPVLVGADGANSAVVRSLQLKRGYSYSIGLNSNIAIPPDTFIKWDGLIGLDYGVLGSYAWVFPKRERFSVGAWSSVRQAHKLKPYISYLVKAYKFIPLDDPPVKGHLMPLRKASTPLTFQRVLLVGDAAGIIDPLIGEGIFYSLRSSQLAAETIIRLLENKTTDLHEYDLAVNRILTPELKIAARIQLLNSLAPRFFFYLLCHNDRFWRAFCHMMRGERSYVELKNRLAWPLKGLLWTG